MTQAVEAQRGSSEMWFGPVLGGERSQDVELTHKWCLMRITFHQTSRDIHVVCPSHGVEYLKCMGLRGSVHPFDKDDLRDETSEAARSSDGAA